MAQNAVQFLILSTNETINDKKIQRIQGIRQWFYKTSAEGYFIH